MDLYRFVRISDSRNAALGGTGYLLSGDRVLTAFHVWRDLRQPEVHFAGAAGGTEKTTKVELAWWDERDPEEKGFLDVAVLKVETGRIWSRCPMDGSPVQVKSPWDSRGWALTARVAGPLPVDEMEPLDGSVHAVHKQTWVLTLNVASPPETAKWWKGASGAPVFSGGRLVGVIRGGPKVFLGGRLRAVAVAALWQAPGFREQAGYLESGVNRVARREKAHSHILRRLEGAADLANALAKETAAWPAKNPNTAKSLAEAICGAASWSLALEAFGRVYEAIDRGTARGRADGSNLAEIALIALPQIYANEMGAVREGGQLVSLPHETETQAELYFAAHDGRPLSYQRLLEDGQYPQGVGLVPLYLPGTNEEFRGWNLEKDRSFEDWLRQFALWVRIDESDYKALKRPGRETELAQRVNAHLEREASKLGKPRRYLCVPADLREVSQPFIEALRSQLRALHVGQVAAQGTRNREREEFDPLALMLYFRDSQKGPSS